MLLTQKYFYPIPTKKEVSKSKSSKSDFDFLHETSAKLPIYASPIENSNTQPPVFTRAQVEQHNKREDIWVTYKGFVYNVTKFVKAHPVTTLQVSYLDRAEIRYYLLQAKI